MLKRSRRDISCLWMDMSGMSCNLLFSMWFTYGAQYANIVYALNAMVLLHLPVCLLFLMFIIGDRVLFYILFRVNSQQRAVRDVFEMDDWLLVEMNTQHIAYSIPSIVLNTEHIAHFEHQ